MKIKEGFVLNKMGQQTVVVSVGAASKIFNGMIKLNETGEFLWNELIKDTNKENLVKALVQEYEVTNEQAQKDVEAFVSTLEKRGIVG